MQVSFRIAIVGVFICITIFCLYFVFWFQAETNLVEAAYEGDLERLKVLIEKGANIDGRGMDDWTALTVAAREGNLKVVSFLLKKGADVNRLEGGGNSALFWATFNGHLAVVKILLAHGADPSKKGEKNRFPIEVAEEKNYSQIVSVIKNHALQQ